MESSAIKLPKNLYVSSEGQGVWEDIGVYWDNFIQPLLGRGPEGRALSAQLFNGRSTLHRQCSGCNQENVSHVDYGVLQLCFPPSHDLFDTLRRVFTTGIKSSTPPVTRITFPT